MQTFACKKCKKCFRKDAQEFEERFETAPPTRVLFGAESDEYEVTSTVLIAIITLSSML